MRFFFIPTLIFSSSLLVSSFQSPISFNDVKKLAKEALDQKIAWPEDSPQKKDGAPCCIINAVMRTPMQNDDKRIRIDARNEAADDEANYDKLFSVEPDSDKTFTISLLDGRENGAMAPSSKWRGGLEEGGEAKKAALVDAFNAQREKTPSGGWELESNSDDHSWPMLKFKWEKPAAATKTSFRASNSDRDQKLEQVNQINRVLLKEMELLQRK